MNTITAHMDKLIRFNKNSNLIVFEKIFPKNNIYLWRKFDIDYKRDVIMFYDYLDIDNRKIFLDYLNANF
jgi:hypothetical protein